MVGLALEVLVLVLEVVVREAAGVLEVTMKVRVLVIQLVLVGERALLVAEGLMLAVDEVLLVFGVAKVMRFGW